MTTATSSADSLISDVKQLIHFWLPSNNSAHRQSSGMGRTSLFWLLAVVLACSPFTARAQELSATLTGTVTDSTGAVIPHAALTVTLNGVAGAGRTVQTDGAGNYTVTNLTAGTYSITVTAEGFQTFKGNNIVLNVAEKHAFDAQLKAGAVTTVVNVEDNQISIDTESSAQAGTIDGVQLRELEISDRNFAMLVTLQPGVVNAGLGDEANTESNTGLAVNGARPFANNWTVDGADINDSGSNNTLVNAPSIDAIQEFTLQRGSYDAGYGRSGGGQVLVATKNGTSSFHGDAYEFVRNTDLDANDYFTKAGGGARAVNHHNDFGYTLGGPIYIPNHYNADKKKTFFFWSEEWQKISAPLTGQVPAANASELSGIIADAAVVDSNGQATGAYVPYAVTGVNTCAGITHDPVAHQSTIPTSCITGKNEAVINTAIFAKYAANSGSNYIYSTSQKNDFRQEILRIDHYFTDALHFYMRGMQDSVPSESIGGMWTGADYPGLSDFNTNTPGKNVVANLTWSINPHMVNELEAVYAQGEYVATPMPGQYFNSTTVSSALTNNWTYHDPYGRNPSISIAGVASYNAGYGPYHERNLDRSLFDNFTYVVGRHTLRAGFQFQQMLKTENGTSGNPLFTFSNTSSGAIGNDTWVADPSWSFGEFLLSNVFQYTQKSNDTIPGLHYINSEAYVQDDWKVSHKLTINLGIRWSRFPAPADNRNTLVNFDPTVYDSAKAPAITPGLSANGGGNFVLPATITSTTLIPGTYANGIILPTGTECTAGKAIAPTASCSPYGSTVNPNYNTNFAPRIGFAYNPDGHGTTSIRGGFGIFYDRLLNGDWEWDAFYSPPLVQTSTINIANFDQVGGGASYISPSPNSLYSTGTPAFKAPNYANYNLSVQRQLLPTTTVEVAYVGNVARHLLGDLDANQPKVGTRVGAAADTTDDVNFLRPYQGYGAMYNMSPIFTNNYNSLQVSANHKAHGLAVGIAYTWSKDLTTSSTERGAESSNTYNIKMDYGPSASNTPQVFEASYVYDLPWYAKQRGVVGHIAGGWELSGITSAISGVSLQVTQGEDPFAVNGNNGIGLAQQQNPQIRVNQTAAVHLTKKVGQWFDSASFSKATSGAFGTEHNGAILGPGIQRWDLAAIKNVKIAERAKFQLRGEMFNAFNHANFNAIDTNIDHPAPASGGSFGTVTSDHGPRIIQVAGKFIF
jgi:hypothetical protein